MNSTFAKKMELRSRSSCRETGNEDHGWKRTGQALMEARKVGRQISRSHTMP